MRSLQLFGFCVLLVLQLSRGASAESRIALVIGNSNYTHTTQLTNPVNDAGLIAGVLRSQGFEVLAYTDVGFKDMRRAIRDFTTKLTQAGKDAVGMVFYAGHGLQAEGINYLVPIDANINKEGDIPVEAIDASSLLNSIALAGNQLNIVVLDACRNNPYKGQFRSSVRGLARVDAPVGSLIAYSTAPGTVAADGDSGNSPFTKALVQAMVVPGLKLEDVFKQARQTVYKITNGAQVPWESSSVFGDFYFQPAVNEPDALPGDETDPKLAAEIAFWNSVKDSDNEALLKTYLDAYPNGSFTAIARTLIEQHKRTDETSREGNDPNSKEAALPPNKFDGAWRLVRTAPACKNPKAQYGSFAFVIKDNEVIWKAGDGKIDADGNLTLVARPHHGGQAIYTGTIEGEKGSGDFLGKNLWKKKHCTGTFTVVRMSDNQG